MAMSSTFNDEFEYKYIIRPYFGNLKNYLRYQAITGWLGFELYLKTL